MSCVTVNLSCVGKLRNTGHLYHILQMLKGTMGYETATQKNNSEDIKDFLNMM